MSFQAVGPEDPKERGPKLVIFGLFRNYFKSLNLEGNMHVYVFAL